MSFKSQTDDAAADMEAQQGVLRFLASRYGSRCDELREAQRLWDEDQARYRALCQSAKEERFILQSHIEVRVPPCRSVCVPGALWCMRLCCAGITPDVTKKATSTNQPCLTPRTPPPPWPGPHHLQTLQRELVSLRSKILALEAQTELHNTRFKALRRELLAKTGGKHPGPASAVGIPGVARPSPAPTPTARQSATPPRARSAPVPASSPMMLVRAACMCAGPGRTCGVRACRSCELTDALVGRCVGERAGSRLGW